MKPRETMLEFVVACSCNLTKLISRYIDVMDTAVLEHLNQLFAAREVSWKDDTYLANPDFQLVATVRTPTTSGLSEAMQSRLTRIAFGDQALRCPEAEPELRDLPLQTPRQLAWATTALRAWKSWDAEALLPHLPQAASPPASALQAPEASTPAASLNGFIHAVVFGSADLPSESSVDVLLMWHQKLTKSQMEVSAAPAPKIKDALSGHKPTLASTQELRMIFQRIVLFDLLSFAKARAKEHRIEVRALPVLNIEGPPGVGKTVACEVAAKLLDRPFVRISCSSCTLPSCLGPFSCLDPHAHSHTPNPQL